VPVTRAYRGVTRLDSARGKKQVWAPCSNWRALGSKCTGLKKILVTLFGFLATRSDSGPHSDSAPGELPPLVTPLRPYKCQMVLFGFEKKRNSCCGKWRHHFWIFDQNSTTACLKYSLDTASASMYNINILCYVAGVITAAFVTVYAKISFLGSFMFSF